MRVIFLLFLIVWQFLNCFGQDFQQGKLVFKIADSHSSSIQGLKIKDQKLNDFISEYGNYIRSFPNHEVKILDKFKNGKVALGTWFYLDFDAKINPEKLSRQLLKNNAIAKAEPLFLNELCYTPNDSLNAQQYYLNAISAFQAWDINKGDTSIVIAIVDTGSDTDHVELNPQFALNHSDPINGLDDDNDGFTDNFYGWDVANNDNNVNFDLRGHGTNVAGLASAATDNRSGISGVGFNSRILTVKIDNKNTAQLTHAYEGIVYAADHGAFIINNSWGSYQYSSFAQDIVNYAAVNKGCLLIGGSGNDTRQDKFYPAAYNRVIAAGATIEGDTVKDESNFGCWLDLFAPGDNMITTNAAGQYGSAGGTSMSAPVIAGCAALVKSHYPNYSAEQIIEQLKATADNVESLSPAQYKGKMGAGRVNVFRALNESHPGIVVKNILIKDGNDSSFQSRDTLRISGLFKNILSTANNVNVELIERSNVVRLLDSTTSFNSIASQDSVNNDLDPFTLVINDGISFNEEITLELKISSANYQKSHFVYLNANKDFITVEENNIRISIASDGSIGYSGSQNQLGEGIHYKGEKDLLYEGSFMIGNSAAFLIDQFRGTNGKLSDFSIQNLVHYISPKDANVELKASFTDSGINNPSFLEIEQHNLIFRSAPAENSILFVYKVKNTSSSTINNLHAGIILDWDLIDFNKNKVISDTGRRMGISYPSDSSLYAGIKVLSDSIPFTHYGIDNVSGGEGGIDPSDGLDKMEKYIAISQTRLTAGNSSQVGNDILDAISIGPLNLAKDSSRFLAFSISFADSLNQLREENDSVQKLYNNLSIGLLERAFESKKEDQMILFPNPNNGEFNTKLNLNEPEEVEFNIYNNSGQLVLKKHLLLEKGNNEISFDLEGPKNAWYFLEAKGRDWSKGALFIVSSK